MIDAAREAEIRRLFFAEHWKKGTIATQFGVHADVVERAIGPLGPAPKSGPRPSLLDPYKPFIQETLKDYPRLRATRLLAMLRERGYSGSVRTLRRYVLAVRPAPRREVFLRTETLPGEQAQIDWGQVGKLRIGTSERPLWLFVIVLKYSRALWAELVLDLSASSLRRSLVRAVAYFGGTTRQWLFDNPKTVVLERQGDAVRFHPMLLELCAELHVQPRLCGVRQPQEKGSVERAVRYFKEAFFAARDIHSIAQGNAQLLQFIEQSTLLRPHPTQDGRTVGDVFADEKAALLALPQALPTTDEIRSVPADKTAFVNFDNNRYSVPHEHAYKVLTLSASDTTVRVLDGDQLVADHPRCWQRKKRIEEPKHRQALLAHKQAARNSKGRGRLQAAVPRIDELLELWALDGRYVGSLTARTCKLLDFYGASALAQATAELLDRGSHDYGALAILCEQIRAKPHVTLPLELADHVNDRDVIPHDIGGYDD